MLILLISSFPLFLWITAENRTKLKKLPVWTAKSGGIKHRTAIMLVIFWTERDFCIIFGYRNSFSNKLKKLMNMQKNSLPAKSLEEKLKTFIGMCSLSHNEFMSWHIHNPLKYLKRGALQKYLTAKSCQLFSKKAPSRICLNTPLDDTSRDDWSSQCDFLWKPSVFIALH